MSDALLLLMEHAGLQEVGRLAVKEGCETFVVGGDRESISIRVGDGRIFGIHRYLDARFADDFDQVDAATLHHLGVTCVLGVKYHSASTAEFLRVVRELLRLYGGWLAADDDGFEPRFDLDQLDAFPGSGGRGQL